MLENFPPLLTFISALYGRKHARHILAKFQLALSVLLITIPEKVRNFVPHMYYQELFMCPGCFGNRAEITLDPEARMAEYVFVQIIPWRKQTFKQLPILTLKR